MRPNCFKVVAILSGCLLSSSVLGNPGEKHNAFIECVGEGPITYGDLAKIHYLGKISTVSQAATNKKLRRYILNTHESSVEIHNVTEGTFMEESVAEPRKVFNEKDYVPQLGLFKDHIKFELPYYTERFSFIFPRYGDLSSGKVDAYFQWTHFGSKLETVKISCQKATPRHRIRTSPVYDSRLRKTIIGILEKNNGKLKGVNGANIVLDISSLNCLGSYALQGPYKHRVGGVCWVQGKLENDEKIRKYRKFGITAVANHTTDKIEYLVHELDKL